MPSGHDRRSVPRVACVVATVLTGALAAGCGSRLKEPAQLASPYAGVQLWAVAPFANESGVSAVDTYRVADLFTQQIQHVDGINAIPVNRVLLAMRHAGIDTVGSAADAMQLAQMLDVDALVVGTVTAWEPYPPPTMGMAVLLFAGTTDHTKGRVDPRELVRAATGDVAPGELGPPGAIAQAAGVFDARNHQTLAWLKAYATGRIEPDEPFGPEVYLMDMELYTQFVSFRLIHDLLDFEQQRLTPVADTESR
ncbi:MAG: hypothetical protein ACYTBR_02655 [Planctomycetota bacterium]